MATMRSTASAVKLGAVHPNRHDSRCAVGRSAHSTPWLRRQVDNHKILDGVSPRLVAKFVKTCDVKAWSPGDHLYTHHSNPSLNLCTTAAHEVGRGVWCDFLRKTHWLKHAIVAIGWCGGIRILLNASQSSRRGSLRPSQESLCNGKFRQTPRGTLQRGS
ncbi:hypothetical protein KC340_g51 [Hortaea werneckii]|nr:hypothetical protein KC340_g51 [Hortaea werneckii]